MLSSICKNTTLNQFEMRFYFFDFDELKVYNEQKKHAMSTNLSN